MYLICEEGKGPLSEESLWYDGGTAKLYLQDQLLYKIYEKPEPHRRAVLDILIQNHTLRDVGVLPKKKIKTTSEKYGLVMNYIDGSVTFRQYLKNKRVPLERMISILIILSDNLKRINQEGIHFSDLHHNNILIKKDGYPLFIDFDDAVVEPYSSHHICRIAHELHEVKEKGFDYEGDLIRWGNLDRECLFIMLLDYLIDDYVERYSYSKFNALVKLFSTDFPEDFMGAISQLKTKGKEILPFPYFVGDFLKKPEVRKGCDRIRRRVRYADNRLKDSKCL